MKDFIYCLVGLVAFFGGVHLVGGLLEGFMGGAILP